MPSSGRCFPTSSVEKWVSVKGTGVDFDELHPGMCVRCTCMLGLYDSAMVSSLVGLGHRLDGFFSIHHLSQMYPAFSQQIMESSGLWDASSYSTLEAYRHFGRNISQRPVFHLHSLWFLGPLTFRASRFRWYVPPETSVDFRRAVQRYIP